MQTTERPRFDVRLACGCWYPDPVTMSDDEPPEIGPRAGELICPTHDKPYRVQETRIHAPR